MSIAFGRSVTYEELMTLGTPEIAERNHQRAWEAAYAGTGFSLREREAVRYRLAHVSGVPDELARRDPQVPEGVYDHVLDSDWDGYTTRERLLLELVARADNDHEALRDDDTFWTEVSANFHDADIIDATYHMIGPSLGRALMTRTLLGLEATQR